LTPADEDKGVLRLLSEDEFRRMTGWHIVIEHERMLLSGTRFVFTVDGVLDGERMRGALYVGKPGQSFADCLPMIDKATAEWMKQYAPPGVGGYMEFGLDDLQPKQTLPVSGRDPSTGKSQ
jgi:hypothetical protein